MRKLVITNGTDEFTVSNYDSNHSIFNELDQDRIRENKPRNEKTPSKIKHKIDEIPFEFSRICPKIYAFKHIGKGEDIKKYWCVEDLLEVKNNQIQHYVEIEFIH